MNRKERRAVKRSPISALIASTRGAYAYASDGKRLAVARPNRPDLAIAIAHAALRTQDSDPLNDLPLSGDDYTFAGWLSADGKRLLDEEGKPIGEIQRGDSLVTMEKGPQIEGNGQGDA